MPTVGTADEDDEKVDCVKAESNEGCVEVEPVLVAINAEPEFAAVDDGTADGGKCKSNSEGQDTLDGSGRESSSNVDMAVDCEVDIERAVIVHDISEEELLVSLTNNQQV